MNFYKIGKYLYIILNYIYIIYGKYIFSLINNIFNAIIVKLCMLKRIR